MSIYKPEGKVITFSIWADNDKKLDKILSDKGYLDISILATTEEEWTPEWADSVNEDDVRDLPSTKENPFW